LTSDGDTAGFVFVVTVGNAPESGCDGNCDGAIVDMAVLGAAERELEDSNSKQTLIYWVWFHFPMYYYLT